MYERGCGRETERGVRRDGDGGGTSRPRESGETDVAGCVFVRAPACVCLLSGFLLKMCIRSRHDSACFGIQLAGVRGE
jgi:hypothetical protein